MILSEKKHYVPALKYSWLTRFYDPVVALSTREKVFRAKLLAQAEINPGDRVLDLGCGTGTFAIMLPFIRRVGFEDVSQLGRFEITK